MPKYLLNKRSLKNSFLLIFFFNLQSYQLQLARHPLPPLPPRGAMWGPSAAPALRSWTRSASTSVTWTSSGSTHLSKPPLLHIIVMMLTLLPQQQKAIVAGTQFSVYFSVIFTHKSRYFVGVPSKYHMEADLFREAKGCKAWFPGDDTNWFILTCEGKETDGHFWGDVAGK